MATPSMKRETCYQALFKRLQQMPTPVQCERILPHHEDVPANLQPAVFMTVTSQTAEQVTGLPTKYHLDAKVWIYAHRDTAGVVPSVAVNQILDELDEVLRPPVGPAFKQTLGGLVEHCWIEGEIHTDEGWLGLQSIAVVPLRMLVVAN
jgi:hypothetical protein